MFLLRFIFEYNQIVISEWIALSIQYWGNLKITIFDFVDPSQPGWCVWQPVALWKPWVRICGEKESTRAALTVGVRQINYSASKWKPGQDDYFQWDRNRNRSWGMCGWLHLSCYLEAHIRTVIQRCSVMKYNPLCFDCGVAAARRAACQLTRLVRGGRVYPLRSKKRKNGKDNKNVCLARLENFNGAKQKIWEGKGGVTVNYADRGRPYRICINS